MKTAMTTALVGFFALSSAPSRAEPKEKFHCACYDWGAYDPSTDSYMAKIGSISLLATVDTANWEGRKLCIRKYRRLNAVAVCEFAR